MTNAAADKPNLMPPAEQIAVDAIKHLAAENYSSQVMKLRTPLLNEAARRLVTPGTTRADVLRWLNEDKGADVDERAWYRFGQRFEEAYKLAWGEVANRVLFSQLAADPSFDPTQLNEFIHTRVMQIVGQEVMSATPGDLDTKRLFAILDAVKVANKSSIDKERLALDKSLADQRIEKLEAEVDRIKLDADRRRLELEREYEKQKIKAVEAAESAVAKGATGEDVVKKVRELLGLPTERGAA